MKYKLLFRTVHISLMDTVLHSHFNLHPLNFLMTLFSAGTITGGADNKKIYIQKWEKDFRYPCLSLFTPFY